MTGYRESLDDWASLHSHHPEPVPAPTYECATHGDYTPTSLIDADCPMCAAEYAALPRTWHRNAEDAADALYTWRHTQHPPT